jgi:hypothetical protein
MKPLAIDKHKMFTERTTRRRDVTRRLRVLIRMFGGAS